MKSNMLVGVLLGIVGWAGAALADGSYYAPERILCRLDKIGTIKCDEFNRNYLTEESTNADLQMHHADIFHFGLAYYNLHEGSIFYTYNNADGKMVKLKTTNSLIHPDFKEGNWVKFNDDAYTCDAGYMSCAMTTS